MFLTNEIETRVKFNPGLSANRPSNNWAQLPGNSTPSERVARTPLHLSYKISL